MWSYLLVFVIVAVFLTWIGFIIGVDTGEKRGFDKGHVAGHKEAMVKVMAMVDKHHEVKEVKETKDKEEKKESPPESPKRPRIEPQP